MERGPSIIVFDDLPVPPSTNQIYKQVGYRRVPSKKLKDFKDACANWMLGHQQELRTAHKELIPYVRDNHWIQLNIFLCLQRRDIWTQQNTIKKLDASNRIKALEDAISDMMGIDDRFFSLGLAEKIVTKQRSKAVLLLRPVKMMDSTQLGDFLVGAETCQIFMSQDSYRAKRQDI